MKITTFGKFMPQLSECVFKNLMYLPVIKKLILLITFVLLTAISYGQDKPDSIPAKEDKAKQKNPFFTFLNAADFDVNGIGKSNYLGHINLYKPGSKSVFARKGSFMGFNVGMMKVSYNSDSSIVHRFENVQIDPIKDIKVGAPYYKQINKYDMIVTNSAYSLYAQPTLTLYSNIETHDLIMFHLHSELLIFNTKVKSTYTTISQDTLIYTAADSVSQSHVSRGNIDGSNTSTYKTSKLNGYFGAGLTFDLKVGNSGSFFFQPTIGWTTNFPNFESYLGRGNRNNTGWSKFYLVRAYFTEEIGNKAKIVLGTDIRGLFPRYSPLYSLYAGLSLNIDAVANLLK